MYIYIYNIDIYSNNVAVISNLPERYSMSDVNRSPLTYLI